MDKALNSHINRVLGRDRIVREVFRLVPEGTWLVGGAIRDLVMAYYHKTKKWPIADYDFIVSADVHGVLHKIKTSLGGTIVDLRGEAVSRIALRSGKLIDISLINQNIDIDLQCRDYTINSIAWATHSGLLDPNKGARDIEKGIIRMVNESNLKSDPLRLLRAYRFMAETGFKVDKVTREAIIRKAELIGLPASERITYEVIKILNTPSAPDSLGEALKSGLLVGVIGATPEVLKQNLKIMRYIQSKAGRAGTSTMLMNQGLTLAGLYRLEALMLNADMGASRLMLSRATLKRVLLVGSLYERFKTVSIEVAGTLFDLFEAAGYEVSKDLLVLTGRGDLSDELRRYGRLVNKKLLTSLEVSEFSGIAPGRQLGVIIRQLDRAIYSKEINTRKQAISWLKLNNRII